MISKRFWTLLREYRVNTRAKNFKCSKTVSLSNSMLCCGHRPIFCRIVSIFVFMSIPFIMAVPLVGDIKPECIKYNILWQFNPSVGLKLFIDVFPIPVIIAIAVVFPAPLCPSNTVICPSYILNEIPLTAIFCFPNRLVNSFTSTTTGKSGSGSNPIWFEFWLASASATGFDFRHRFCIHSGGCERVKS